MEPGDLAREAMEVIYDKKGWDIVILDLRPLSSFTDYFVIGSAANARQIKALSDELLEKLEKKKEKPLNMEGGPESGWVLLDYGGVIVHLFTPPVREYYQLERLWHEAPLVVRMQ
ncbi:MAG: ribosome silencing factor [Chloroflexi bacterium]|nr:ribosome silencing factor [Chloroflexota bacterium]